MASGARKSAVYLAVALLLAGTGATRGQGTSASWNNTAAGNWADTSKWTGSLYAEGVGNTATFVGNVGGTINITQNVGASLTIGHITLTDADSNGGWSVGNHASNVLNLQTGAGAPTLTCNNANPGDTGTGANFCYISAPLTGTQGFVKEGTGFVGLNKDNSGLSGPIVVNAGTIAVQHNNALGGTADGTTVNAGYLAIGGNITCPENITFGTNTYLRVLYSNQDSIFSGLITLGGNMSVLDRTGGTTWIIYLTFNRPGTGSPAIDLGANTLTMNSCGSGTSTITILDPIVGAGGSLVKGWSGVLTLAADSANNTYTGPTTVNGGTLRAVDGGGGVPAGPTGSFLDLNNSAWECGSNIVRPVGTAGQGNVQLRGANPTLSAYNGPMTVACGTYDGGALQTLTWGAGGFSPSTALVLNGAATGKLTFSNPLDLNAAVRTITVNANTVELSGALSGAAGSGLTKAGAGTLILGAGHSYPGATTISAGILVATGNQTASSGFVVNNTAKLSPGTTNVAGGVLTVNTLQLDAGSGLVVEFNASPTNDRIVVANSGGLTINGGAVTLLNEAGAAWSTDGTYNLVQYSGALGGAGVATLSVANPQAGKSYFFFASGGWIKLTIVAGGNYTWDGSSGADSCWKTAANWNPDTAPVATGALFFATANRLANTNDFDANTRFSGVVFNNGAGAFVLSGNAVNLIGNVTNNDADLQTISLDLVLDGGGREFNANAGSLNVGGVIGEANGSWGINKVGAQALILSNSANAYSGETRVGAGTLKLGMAGVIPDASRLNLAAGTFDLNGKNETVGSLAGAAGGVGNTLAASPVTLTIGADNLDTSYSGVIAAGTSAITLKKTGSGTQTLGGANLLTGGISLDGGTLAGTVAGAFGTAANTVTFNGGNMELRAGAITYTALLNMNSSGGTITGNPAAAGAGVSQVIGALTIGTRTLTYVAGALAASGNQQLTVGATTLTGNPTFSVSNGTANGILVLGAVNDGTTARTIGKSGNGALTLGTACASLVDGTQVNIGEGTLNANNATALGGLARVDVADGATFGVGASQTIGSLSNATSTLNSGVVSINGAYTLTVGAANNLPSAFSGTISGASGALVKAGTNAVALTGTNTYGGATTINNGLLDVRGALTASALTVNNAGAILCGTGSVKAVTVTAGKVMPGVAGAGTIGKLTANGNYNQANANGNLTVEITGTGGPGSGNDQLAVVGTVTLGAGLGTLTVNSTYNPPADSYETFVIVDNDGTDAVSGNFSGYAEGSAISIGTTSGYITYKHPGAAGNDIALVAARSPKTFTSKQNGNWSDPNTWNEAGGPPLAQDTVTLQNGHDVVYDAASAGTVASLTLTRNAGISSLTLQRSLHVTTDANLYSGGSGATLLDLQGQALSVDGTLTSASTMSRSGGSSLTATTFVMIAGVNFTCYADDRIGSVSDGNSGTVFTTAHSNNLSTAYNTTWAGRLALGADLNLTGNMDMDRGWFSLNGHNVHLGGELRVGPDGANSGANTAPTDARGTETMDLGSLYLNNDSVWKSAPGDRVRTGITFGNSYQTVGGVVAFTQQVDAVTGLTLDASSGSAISFGTSLDRLQFAWDPVQTNGVRDWVFRWQGDHADVLRSWYNGFPDYRLYLTLPADPPLTFDPDYHIFYNAADDYTYIGYSNAVTTTPEPIIENLSPLYVGTTGVRARGDLVSTGTADTAVFICWGLSDAQTNQLADKWEHTNAVSGYPHAQGVKNVELGGLLRGSNYFYRFSASNSHGVAWASSTANFATLNSANFTSRLSGAWSTVSSWTPFGNPSTGDTVTITYGHDITNDVDASGAVSNVTVNTGAGNSSLTLGRNLNVSGVATFYGDLASLDLNGKVLNAGTLRFYSGGVDSAGPEFNRTGGGSINVGTFQVDNMKFYNWTLDAADVIGYLYLGGSRDNHSLTTAAAGNITGNMRLDWANYLILGSDLSMTGGVATYDRATVEFGNHSATWGGTWTVGTGLGGVLRATQPGGSQSGATFSGDINLVNAGSVIQVVFDAGSPVGSDWGLRWAGDRVAALQGYYSAGKLQISNFTGFDTNTHITYNAPDNYTYVGIVPVAGEGTMFRFR